MADSTEQDTSGTETQPRNGVVAVIDALGFAALSSKYALTDIVRVLRKVKKRSGTSAVMGELFQPHEIQAVAFSDTVIVACVPRAENLDFDLDAAVSEVADIVGDLLIVLSGESPPLIYRGCISVGPLVAEDEIIVGDAVNDAAKHHELAAAAIVWLTPDAQMALAFRRGESPWFFDWPVPLNSGETVQTFALNPLWSMIRPHGQSRNDALISKFLAPFEDSRKPDVVQKEQNTTAFLEAAKSYSENECSRFAQNLYESAGPGHDDDAENPGA